MSVNQRIQKKKEGDPMRQFDLAVEDGVSVAGYSK